MRATFTKTWRMLGISAFALLLAGCAGDATQFQGPSEPELNSSYNPGRVRLAKIGPVGSTATFHISATGGSLPAGSTITLNACQEDGSLCIPADVWYATSGERVEVTITEIGFTGNLVLERINVQTEAEGNWNIFAPQDPSVTVGVYTGNSALVRFKNVEGPPPPPPPPPPSEGVAGCTPGFWRQPQHFQYWTSPYTPTTQFSAVFANAFPGKTLHDVVKLGGGGLNALGRHTVAALLNGASPDVDYGYGAADVISAFNAAFASGSYEGQKNIFEGWNERDCTAKD